jgi:hypothetical protein
MLKNSKIIHWYAQNCGSNPDHNRFTCIPLGIQESQMYSTDKTSNVQHLLMKPNSLVINKSFDRHKLYKNLSYTLLLPAFNMFTHPDRFVVRGIFCNDKSTSKLQKIYTNDASRVTSLCLNHVSEDEMFSITSNSKFVISPHGKGLDCHRTWESLYLGSYVIVKTSTLDEMYKDLPVLIVNSWEDITVELLDATYFKFSTTKYNYDKLRTSHWYDTFRSHGYNIIDYTFNDFNKYSNLIIENYNLKDNDLIKGDMNIVYSIFNNKKHLIPSLDIFKTYWKWDFDNVIILPEHDLEIIRSGDDIATCIGDDEICNNET